MTEHHSPLVDIDWLAARLDDPTIRVIDVDEDTTAYEKGHIPAAVGWNWFSDLHTHPQRDYIDRDGVRELLAEAGVDADTIVVLYGGNNNWFAAYAYWLLRYRGFDAIRLLDGGRKKWELDGRELTDEVPSYPRGTPALADADRPELRALREYVLQSLSTSAFVDVRSPEEYRGEVLAPPHLPQEQAQVPGHIPGAVNVPWAKAANEDGTFRDIDELRALYGEVGVLPDTEVIAYCRIGERSAHTWFVLHELLGYPDVSNYDGSWTEYGSLVGAPVER